MTDTSRLELRKRLARAMSEARMSVGGYVNEPDWLRDAASLEDQVVKEGLTIACAHDWRDRQQGSSEGCVWCGELRSVNRLEDAPRWLENGLGDVDDIKVRVAMESRTFSPEQFVRWITERAKDER